MFQGHGVECASIGEVLHTLDIGFAPERIVFDSPVKTISELSMTFLLKSSFSVNFGYLWQSASLIILSCVQSYASYEIHAPYIFVL